MSNANKRINWQHEVSWRVREYKDLYGASPAVAMARIEVRDLLLRDLREQALDEKLDRIISLLEMLAPKFK